MDNVHSKPSFFKRFFCGIFRALDTTRRLVLNLVFLGLVVALIVLALDKAPVLKDKTALVIAPKGAIVEQYSASAMDRAIAKLVGDEVPETQLRDVLRALEAAAKDPKVDRVVILPDKLQMAGVATLREIGAALQRFKVESKKEVIAYGDMLDQRGYYLAAHADKVYLDPEGAVFLEGLGRYRMYFKDAFDKFGVEARLFRVGEYKSAGERYVRSDQSPEAREADRYWLGDLWQRYLADVAGLRGLKPEQLAADVDGIVDLTKAAGGDLAQLAKDKKWVDGLKTRGEIRELLIEKGEKEEDDDVPTFRQIGVEEYVANLDKEPHLKKAELGVVIAEGEIVDGNQPPGMIGGYSTARLLRQAREDKNIKVVVLRVDSPGGGVFPSELIRREVALTKAAGKPVVVSMGDVAASGGYWISMNADKIYASPSTITGSIGIFGLWMNFPQALAKLGLRTDGTSTTWIPQATDPSQPYDARLGDFIQTVIDRGYRQFIGKVAKARGKEPSDIDAIARGRVWSGQQAKDRGLVDELGNFYDALQAAAKLGKLDAGFRVKYIEKEPSAVEALVESVTRSALGRLSGQLGAGALARWMPASSLGEMEKLKSIARDVASQKPVAMYAHCECLSD